MEEVRGSLKEGREEEDGCMEGRQKRNEWMEDIRG
jgi:hypothetical protein